MSSGSKGLGRISPSFYDRFRNAAEHGQPKKAKSPRRFVGRVRPRATHAPGLSCGALCRTHTNGVTMLNIVYDRTQITCKSCLRLLAAQAAADAAAEQALKAMRDAEYIACPHCGGVFKP